MLLAPLNISQMSESWQIQQQAPKEQVRRAINNKFGRVFPPFDQNDQFVFQNTPFFEACPEAGTSDVGETI